ncbi:MAG: insulinase family protein [[Pasteurella] mairii]|uniref:PqqL n=1 Tax=[Pasteurella] mairii TaxID=757 RepID=A0A379B6N3_9PAST|nr:insulinase family protein [[Pasteurella] mairii]SUB34132.1 PqqL [[Pasteurella] mairii]
MRFHFLFSFLFCLGLVACISSPNDYHAEKAEKLPFSQKIQYGELENGLRYYILPHQYPKERIYIRLVVNAGSLHEDEDQRGVAHIIEHLAFNGSRKYPKNQIISALEQLGMKFARDINAFTDFENTVYTLNLANNDPKNLELAFDVLDQWINHLTLLPEDLDAERGVVLEEWRARLSPILRLGDKKSAIEMAGSRYVQRDPIGLVEVINNVSAKRVADFYHKWYRPDNMAIIVVGDIDTQTARSLIQKKLSTSHPSRGTTLPHIDFSIPLTPDWRFASINEKHINTPTIELSFAEEFHNQDNLLQYRQQFSRQVVIRLLNLRLQQWEKQQSTVETASFSHHYLGKETSQFIFSIPLREEKYQSVLLALFDFLAELQQQGFSQQEFEQEIAYLAELNENQRTIKSGSLILIQEMMASVANKQVILSEEQKYRLNKKMLAEINLAEINRAFQQIIQLNAKLLLITQPYPAKKLTFDRNQVKQWWQQAMISTQQKWKSTKTTSDIPDLQLVKGHVQKEKNWQQGNIQEYRLQNGSKLVYYYSDKMPNQVYFKALTQGGLRSVPKEQFYLLKSAANLVDDSGIGTLAKPQLEQLVSYKQLMISTFLDDYYQGFTGIAKSQDMELLLKLFRLKLQHSEIDHTVFQQYQHELKQSNQQNDIEINFMQQLDQQRYPDLPTIYHHSKERLYSTTLTEFLQLYQDYILDKTDFTYFIVGDIQELQLLNFAERYLANVPIKTQQRQPYFFQAKIPSHPLIIQGFDEPRAEVELFFNVESPWRAENEYLLDLLSDILQEQLRLTLRENDSGIYSVNTWFSQEMTSSQIEGKIEFSCDPQRVDELIQAAYRVVNELEKQGVDPAILKKKVAEKHIQIRQQFDSLLIILGLLEKSYRLTDSPKLVYLYQHLDKIATKDNLDSMIKKVLQKQGRFQAILKP